MKRRMFFCAIGLAGIVSPLMAQNVGINTNTPTHPFQVNVDSSYTSTTLDQSVSDPNSSLTIPSGQAAGQQVVCSLSGGLSRVDLLLNTTGIGSYIAFRVRQGSVPGGTLLVEQYVIISNTGPSVYTFQFTPLSVDIGDSLFLEVENTLGNDLVWSDNSTDPYAPGVAFMFNGSWTMLSGDDMIFSTYVDIPESQSVPVLKVLTNNRVAVKNYMLPEVDGAAGQVMVTNGTGDLSWTGGEALNSVWKTTGNTGTGAEFIGTTNDYPLRFKVNNYNAGFWDVTKDNYAIGEDALKNVGSGIGQFNIALGGLSLYNNIDGQDNIVAGVEAMFSNTTGGGNVALGFQTLYYNTGGQYNTAIGHTCMHNNTDGPYNTAAGWNALYSNTTGEYNTGIGTNAMTNLTTANFDTGLGANTGPLTGNPWNYTAIGYEGGHQSDQGNRVEIGGNTISWIGGEVGWSTYSDARIKDNVKENVPGLDFINKLRPVTYNINVHREDAICGIRDTVQWEGKYDLEHIVQSGFIAQEVENAAKSCSYDFNGVTNPGKHPGLYSLQYGAFVIPLTKAVQELSAENERLTSEAATERQQLASLKSQNAALQTEVDALKSRLTALSVTMQQLSAEIGKHHT